MAPLLILAGIASASSAQTPAKSLRDQLVGHWQLVSVTINDRSPYGANAQGSMFLDAGNHYSGSSSSPQARRAASRISANTRSTTPAGSVTFHVDASSRTGATERDQIQTASFNGDVLTLADESPARSAAPS